MSDGGPAIMPFEVELGGSKEFGPCECCGNMSRTVWGFVNSGSITRAAYYVQWTPKKLDHGANFDLVVGTFGEGSLAKDRFAVSLAYRVVQNGPEFMVIDAAHRPHAKGDLAGRALQRAEVIGRPLANEVFALVDAIYLMDDRIAELRGMRPERE